MFDYNIDTNPNGCPQFGDSEGSGITDNALFCNKDGITDFLTPNDMEGTGCNPDVCDNCTVSFTTTLPDNEKTYNVSATVIPSADGESSTLTIDSTGSFSSLSRKVELYMTKAAASDLIVISDSYATPISSAVGTTITIAADVQSVKGVSSVGTEAHIKATSDGDDVSGSPVSLTLSSGTVFDGTFTGTWTGPVGAYYVDIIITDVSGNTLEQDNVQAYSFE